MTTAFDHTTDPDGVLGDALGNVGRFLGMSQTELGAVIGKDRSAISRGRIDPASKPGELALLMIRLYRALHVLMGGDPEHMQHWMRTPNHHTGGIPVQQATSIQGLVTLVEYLDAMRGKI